MTGQSTEQLVRAIDTLPVSPMPSLSIRGPFESGSRGWADELRRRPGREPVNGGIGSQSEACAAAGRGQVLRDHSSRFKIMDPDLALTMALTRTRPLGASG